MAHQEYLSAHEIAQLLGFGPQTVKAWVLRGRLPAMKVGNAYRIAREGFDRLRESAVFQVKKPDVATKTGPELAGLYQEWRLDMQNGTQPCSPATVETPKAPVTKYIRILLELDPGGTLTYRDVADARTQGGAADELRHWLDAVEASVNVAKRDRQGR